MNQKHNATALHEFESDGKFACQIAVPMFADYDVMSEFELQPVCLGLLHEFLTLLKRRDSILEK